MEQPMRAESTPEAMAAEGDIEDHEKMVGVPEELKKRSPMGHSSKTT